MARASTVVVEDAAAVALVVLKELDPHTLRKLH